VDKSSKINRNHRLDFFKKPDGWPGRLGLSMYGPALAARVPSLIITRLLRYRCTIVTVSVTSMNLIPLSGGARDIFFWAAKVKKTQKK
jgi:hypothetical protein